MPDNVVDVVGLNDGSATVIAAVAVFPSLVAVIVELPTATPVTTPAAETVATFCALDVHVTVRPVNALPAASFSATASVNVLPIAIGADDGVIVTVATGTIAAATVIVALPLLPSLVAVIDAVPGATPVTDPLVDTVATVDALVVQVTVRPLNAFPDASSVEAESCCIPPTVSAAVFGVTDTEATGTVTGAVVSLLPPQLARNVVKASPASRVMREARFIENPSRNAVSDRPPIGSAMRE